MKMVSIDSESGFEDEFAKYMIKIGGNLGLKTKMDAAGNVYLISGGEGKAIMLNTHLDTVSPGRGITPRKSGGFIVSGGDTILGADSKAGIAAMVEAIRIINEGRMLHRPFVITLTRNEESGIPTANKITTSIKECVVVDRGAPIGEIITRAPYAQVFEVTINGKTAYAPTNYNDGNHAIDTAVAILSTLPRGNIDENTTVNVGIIQGGEAASMVPSTCKFKGSCYSFSKKSLDSFICNLSNSVGKWSKRLRTNGELNFLEYFGGYDISRDDPLVAEADQATRDAGLIPRYAIHKAVTNANILNNIGIKSVLISTGVENQHTTKERISIGSLVKLTKVITNVLTK